MFRKVVIVSVLVTAGAMLFPMSVSAQSSDEGRFRAAGAVVSIEEGESSFLMRSIRQGEMTIAVTDETEYRSPSGHVRGLEDLTPEMKLIVVGEIMGGEHIATMVGVPDPEGDLDLARAAGLVQQVNPDAGSFSIETREGDLLRLSISDRTRYFSRDSSLQGLEDLHPGDAVRVVYSHTDSGLMAMALQKLALRDRPDRPRIDFRAAGEISALGGASFTLHTREGERVTLVVTHRTKYLSRSGEVTGFSDLQVGMHALVAGIRTDDGQLVALLVAVGDGDRAADRMDRDNRSDRWRQRLKSDFIRPPGDSPRSPESLEQSD